MAKKQESEADFQIRFYEQILRRAPDFIEALIALGDLYTRKGMTARGLEMDLKLSRLRPQDPIVLYNLACSYSLMAEIDKAFGAIKMALECGYDDLHFLQKDDDLQLLRQDERFQEYLSQYRSKKVAQPKR